MSKTDPDASVKSLAEQSKQCLAGVFNYGLEGKPLYGPGQSCQIPGDSTCSSM
jgi:hypothetical protein